MPILAIHSLTRSLQPTGKRVFSDGTHNHMTSGHSDLKTESAQRAILVIAWFFFFFQMPVQRKGCSSNFRTLFRYFLKQYNIFDLKKAKNIFKKMCVFG